MRIITEPEIYVVGRQTLDSDEVRRFLEEAKVAALVHHATDGALALEVAASAASISVARDGAGRA